ncbi:MAG: L-2-hydroxyglutarate oxidase [Desulfuromonadales bacterium]
MSTCYDLAIIGGGIVGCATAMEISGLDPKRKIVLFEKEAELATHQTGHNSGVIHAGLYYRPGSIKATTCSAGRQALYRFCAEHKIPHQRCGKVVVAVEDSDIPALDELERRGRANGLENLQRLTPAELQGHEPHVRGVAGLFVPQTGIVDYPQVAQQMAAIFARRGGLIRRQTPIQEIRCLGEEFALRSGNETFRARTLINCAGLHSDRVARLAGLRPALRIIPFRGEYYQLDANGSRLVAHLIYPVPDPEMPFLGVHFTRMIDGTVEAGPNAVLALKREGYRRRDVSFRDMAEICIFPGFWKLAARYWRVGLTEYGRSFSKTRFARDLARLVPTIQPQHLIRGGSGVRAQAVDNHGKLLDDFQILTEERMIHVLNAPSPAATASLSIAAQIADRYSDL